MIVAKHARSVRTNKQTVAVDDAARLVERQEAWNRSI
jgi:hypothetical protein